MTQRARRRAGQVGRPAATAHRRPIDAALSRAPTRGRYERRLRRASRRGWCRQGLLTTGDRARRRRDPVLPVRRRGGGAALDRPGRAAARRRPLGALRRRARGCRSWSPTGGAPTRSSRRSPNVASAGPDAVVDAAAGFGVRTAFTPDLLEHGRPLDARRQPGPARRVPARPGAGCGCGRSRPAAGTTSATCSPPPSADDPMHQAAGAQLSRLGVAAVSLRARRPGWRVTSARRLRRLVELLGPAPPGGARRRLARRRPWRGPAAPRVMSDRAQRRNGAVAVRPVPSATGGRVPDGRIASSDERVAQWRQEAGGRAPNW